MEHGIVPVVTCRVDGRQSGKSFHRNLAPGMWVGVPQRPYRTESLVILWRDVFDHLRSDRPIDAETIWQGPDGKDQLVARQ
jgi:hypothetical protein